MIKNLLLEGFTLKSQGHYKHAIEVFYKALEHDNASSELLLEIADLYFLMGNTERALNYIEQILEKEPAHIPSLKILKKIFEAKEAFEEAEQTAKNIYCISQENEDLVEILKLLNLQGKFDEIFEYNIKAPTCAIYLEQAKAKFFQKDYNSAEKILNRALTLDSTNQDILLLLSKTLFLNNKKDISAEIAQQIRFDNNNPDLINFLAQIETYLGHYSKAQDYLKIAIKKDNSNSEFYFNLANAYYKQGEHSLAKKNYNLAISLNPENKNYHFALANLYYVEKHYKKALEELKGNFFEAKLLKAVILYDTGYLALAKKQLIVLGEERPDNELVKDYKNRIDEELRITI